jgi:hypothetical protein
MSASAGHLCCGLTHKNKSPEYPGRFSLRFVARLLDGEKMAGLCREFGISRKTGYKIFNRYKDCGLEGLTDRSPYAAGARRSAFE